MVTPFVETYFFIERAEFAVDAGANESIAREFGQLLFEFSLAAPNHRRQHHDPLAFGQCEHIMQNLFDALPGNGRAALVTMGQAD